MRISQNIMAVVSCLALIGCGQSATFKSISNQEEFTHMIRMDITNAADLAALFPKTVEEINSFSAWAADYAQKQLDSICALPIAARTCDNTVKALDEIGAQFSAVVDTMSVLEMVSPDTAIREACQKQLIIMREFAVDSFASKRVYAAFKDYVEHTATHEQLSDEVLYSITESMKSFRRAGLDKPDAEYNEIQRIKKELSKVAMNFETNIAADHSTITATREELEGMDPNHLATLEHDAQGNYTLGCDYPTYFEVMENCHRSETRKKLFHAYNNRAYPKNYELLGNIIAQRHELAQRLEYPTYAALDLDNEMVQTTDRAYDFLKSLIRKCQPKLDQEVANLIKELPEGVVLTADGRFNPWDFTYVKEVYKKKHLAIDERKIAEYFTVDRTLEGVFKIYQEFLGLTFKLIKPEWAWDDDVQLIEVHDRAADTLRGFIFLDLYPRPNKYSHACHAGLISTIKRVDPVTGQASIRPSAAVVIANFPKAANGRPALLKFNDVETFFHEFGHAMHALLGATELSGNSGTAVKLDFVEMPSQMFENWLYEKEILQPLTAHYQTNEPLPAEMIDKMIALKKFESGSFVVRQCMLGLVSLDLFNAGPNIDIDSTLKTISRTWVKHVAYDPESHFCAAFGHLTGYGAKYYSYMWSKVFAIDVFYRIKELGLGDPAVGKRFVDMVLGRGGSIEPDEMLKTFLGRPPTDDAFVHDLGIHT